MKSLLHVKLHVWNKDVKKNWTVTGHILNYLKLEIFLGQIENTSSLI